MKSLLATSLLLATALMIAGCGSPLIETRLDDPTKLPDRHGVVAVQVISNTRRLAPVLDNWTAVFAVDLDDFDKRYRLQPHNTGLLGSRVFVGALPPGHYAIFNLHSFLDLGDRQYWLNAPLPRVLGSFEVAENHLTNLGSLVYQPLGDVKDKRGRERRAYVVTRQNEEPDLESFVAEAFPDFNARRVIGLTLGWLPDGNEGLREDLAKRVSNVNFAHNVERVGDDVFAMGGKLGRIVWRGTDGRWQTANTGYGHEIGTIAAYVDGYVAAGERGLVLSAPSLEGPWKLQPGPGPLEAVYWMRALSDGTLAAMTSGGDHRTLYRVSSDLQEWSVLRRFEIQRRLFSTYWALQPVISTEGRLVLFHNSSRLEYDTGSNRFTESSGMRLLSLRQQPDGVLVALPGNDWTGVGRAHLSRDDGRTWTPLRIYRDGEAPDSTSFSLPFVGETGEEIKLSRMYVRSQTSTRARPSSDRHLRIGGGEKISRWGAAVPEHCTDLLPEVSRLSRLFLMCNDGTVMLSEDAGANWTEDRSLLLDPDDVPDSMKGGEATET